MKTIIIMGLMLATAGAAAGEDLVLENGKTLEDAIVVRLNPAIYIVQTADALLELSEDEIDSASLQKRNFQNDRPPTVTHQYYEIHADGTATCFWTFPITNRSKYVMDELRMGLAPWEREVEDQRRYFDGRGMPLTSTYDPPKSQWADQPNKRVQHNMQLNEPLAPGEEMTFSGQEISNRISRTDEGLTFKFHGDYSEDRLLTLKVRLPQGAQIIKVSPDPSVKFESDGSEYLVWRRYYQKAEVYPIEVVYNLD